MSYVNFNAEHVATENATYTLTVGNSINLYNGSGVVSTSGSTYYGAVLYSVDVEVPAHTRYNIPLYTQAVGTHHIGNGMAGAYARIYACGNDPSKVPANYYASSNSPSAYCIAARSATKRYGTATANAATTQTYAFDNASKNTKTVRRYFVSIAGGYKNGGSGNQKTFNNYIQLAGEITQQRLVPTSYDVEYDQLRHSLEEEYYEAIRLDENYPTEGVRVTSGYTGGWNGMANCIDPGTYTVSQPFIGKSEIKQNKNPAALVCGRVVLSMLFNIPISQ